MDKNKEILLQIVQGYEDSEEIAYVRALLETFKILDWSDRDVVLGVAQNFLESDQYDGKRGYEVNLYDENKHFWKDE